MTATPLDPMTALVLRIVKERDETPAIVPLRDEFRALNKLLLYRGNRKAGGIEDVAVGRGLSGRLFRPSKRGVVPLIVFFHGGGWVVGDVASYDTQCRRLRDGTGAAVLSIEYRLAPEARFPAAADDCIAATRWAVEHAASLGCDPARVAVAGDSAGGNLAAVVAQAMRDAGVALRGQLLIYPACDSVGLRSGEASARYPSHELFKNGYLLTLERMQWYTDQYLPDDADRAKPKASPLRATSLAGLAPAIVATAGFDPLRDEGRAYAEALRAAGTPVTYFEFPDLIHGYFALAALSPGSRTAAKVCCLALAELLR